MAELHVVSALLNKGAELAGMVGELEQQLARQRTNLAHLDATLRLFDPHIRPQKIRAKQQRARSAWFLQGECFRQILCRTAQRRAADDTGTGRADHARQGHTGRR
jgi:hypothetical protein